MKKLIEKDKKLRKIIKHLDKEFFVLKSIFKNLNFSTLVRWKALLELKTLGAKNSKVSLSPKCLLTLNKKKYNKLTFFSRHVFLKLIRKGFIPTAKKASW